MSPTLTLITYNGSIEKTRKNVNNDINQGEPDQLHLMIENDVLLKKTTKTSTIFVDHDIDVGDHISYVKCPHA
jgi:hypothetical protein